MKKITTFLLIYSLFAVANNLFAQDRTPFYVHGYWDNNTQWANWRTVFNNERKMTTGDNTSYTSSQGVASMATAVATELNKTTNINTIYFGHSMGGVVGRHIDVNNTSSTNSKIGGYITAGSPLDGAHIANSINNGNLTNYVTVALTR